MRYLSCLAILVSTVQVPSPSLAQDLYDVLEIVYQTNPNIRAERNRQNATEELKDQALAGALPQVVGSASIGKTTNNQTTTAGLFSGGNPTTQRFKLENTGLSVSGEQAVFTGFRNYNAFKQARSRIDAGAAQLDALEQQVLFNAVTAYFDVARDLEVYNANASNVAVLLKQLDDSKVRFELGDITRTDVLQAEARLAGARAQLSGAKSNLADSRARYKEIVGSAPGTLIADRALPALPETVEEAIAIAFENAPAFEIVQQEEKASRREIQIAQGARLPTVSLTASYSRADEPSSFIIQDEQWSYGIRATIPIFQGGLEFSRLREAKALNARDRARVVATERNVEAQVTAVWDQLFEARSRIESATAQAGANEQALEGVRREAELGVRTTLDVLNAEQEYLNATVSLASAKRDEQVAAYALLTAIGLFTIDAAMVTTDVVSADDAPEADKMAVIIERALDEDRAAPGGEDRL